MKYEDLKEMIGKINGTAPASIDTHTEVKLLGGKKNPQLGRVTKRNVDGKIVLSNSSRNVYEFMVKKRLIEEGKDFTEFELKARPWGTRIGDTCFIEHKGEIYLEIIYEKSGKTIYYLDGEEISEDEIQGLPEKKVNEDSQAGLENKVIIRTVKISSIERIRSKGEIVV